MTITEDVYIFPTSFAQQRLWFLDQLQPGTPFYNVPAAIRIRGALNIPALEASLTEIIQRHESLRTTIPAEDGQPVQRVTPVAQVSLPIIDLEANDHMARETEIANLVREEARQPFDLARGPLLRTSLVRASSQEHILLLTMHHIICDGWSIGVLMRELATLYTAYANGQHSPLPELPIQYVDFTIWQQQFLQSTELQAHMDYWRQQLRGAPAVLELPTDRPRPPVQTFWGDRQILKLPATLVQQLQALSRQADATLFMTLLAAFNLLLYRYSGQDDIVVGSPIANRTRAELEPLIGFFVNMLVLRTDLTGDPGFRDLLKRVRQVTLEAYEHQDIPFDRLVDELQPVRDTSHTPVFQVVFILQNTPMPALELPGLTLSLEDSPRGIAKFDLTLEATETDDGLLLAAEYNTDLFDSDTIARLLGHYQQLLESIVANPQCPVSQLPLLTGSEYQQLVYAWNNNDAAYPQDTFVHALFAEQARRMPAALAVVDSKQRLTYQEVNQRANQLAHVLRGMGVGPDVLVALCVPRCADFIIGLMGILKAGGAYVPLDPTIPERRLQTIISDAEIRVVLAHQELRGLFSTQDTQVLCLDTAAPLLMQQPAYAPDINLRPDNLAYVIYTSGSTGTPKGVLLMHRGLTNLAFWYRQAFKVTPRDRTTQIAGLGFDATVWELLPGLTAGVTTYLPNDEIRSTPELLRDWLVDEEITITFLPTPLAERLLSLDWPAKSALRVMQTGGEALKRYPPPGLPFTLYNNYGPSESTVAATSTPVPPLNDAPFPPPIGYPLNNSQIYILDRQMQPVPIGVPGELCIGGANVGRGYLKRPGQTATQFIPDPFSRTPGARLYRTGDLVRYRSDRQIEFLGRIDTQVKVRGFRIELGEIETTLTKHPTVHETVVLAREDTPGERYLAAYVVSDAGCEVNVSDLRSFLKETLPEYMVPGIFVKLDALPLTPNGKVDRRALPAPEGGVRPVMAVAYVAPQDELEETIAAIWQEVLGVERVGVEDSFFDLGGNSLLMARTQSKLATSLQQEISILDLFKYPTIKSLAQFLGQGQATQRTGKSVRDRARKQKEIINRHKNISRERR